MYYYYNYGMTVADTERLEKNPLVRWKKALMAEFLNSEKNNEVLFAEADKFEALFEYMKGDVNTNFTLTVADKTECKRIKKIFNGFSNVTVLYDNLYTKYYLESRSFDYIYAVPDIEGRLQDEDLISREYSAIALEVLLARLKNNGKLMIVMPSRFTFEGDKIKDLRDYVENNYRLLSIKELPEGLRRSVRQIILTVEKTRPSSDDCILLETLRSAKDSATFCVKRKNIVKLADLQRMKFWALNLYLGDDETSFMDGYLNSSCPKVRLGEFCQIFRGREYKLAVDNDGISVNLLNIKDIVPDIVDVSSTDMISLQREPDEFLFLRKNDIVIPCRGTGSMKVGLINGSVHNVRCLVSSNVICLRCLDGRLNPDYLMILLQSPVGLNLLQSVERGHLMKQISAKDIETIEIPLLPLVEQEKIKQTYWAEAGTFAAAQDRWNEIRNDLYSQLF